MALALLTIVMTTISTVTAFKGSKDGLTVTSLIGCSHDPDNADSYPRDKLHAKWSDFAGDDKNTTWKLSEFHLSDTLCQLIRHSSPMGVFFVRA